jgi:hypothetical protein
VAADCDRQAHGFNSKPAQDECDPPRGVRKEQDGGNGQKKSGWHNQQSGIFHDSSLTWYCMTGWRFCRQRYLELMDDRSPDNCPQRMKGI